MDKFDYQALQQQVQALCDKVDTLQTIVGELQTSPGDRHRHPLNNSHYPGQTSPQSPPVQPPEATASIWEIDPASLTDIDPYSALPLPNYLAHKDIIEDNETSLPFWSHAESTSMTPEIQIRRLTAQLTAAYHRIAALEEQIIAQRHHPLPTYKR